MNLFGMLLFLITLQLHNPMGFDQDKTTHHFVLTASGGYIDVTVHDASDQKNLSAIREHLTYIAVKFKDGDFNIPMLVHGQLPPGTEIMKRSKGRIDYQFKVMERGGRVTITTNHRGALQAIHEFIRYQIQEHNTGDSLTVPKPLIAA